MHLPIRAIFFMQYRFGCSFPSLLEVCGAETVTIEDISSMSQVCAFILFCSFALSVGSPNRNQLCRILSLERLIA